MKKLIIILSYATILFSGCTKSSNTNNIKSSTEIDLTGHIWRQTAIYHNNVNQNIGDCVKDDTYKFQSGGLLVFDQGATKCNTTDPQTHTTNWTLSSNNFQLFITDNGQSYLYTITYIDSSRLEMTVDLAGGLVTEREIFHAQ